MYFHGARFSNYEAWLTDPTHIKPSAQIVCCSSQVLNEWWFPYSNYFRFLPIMAWFRNHKLQLYTTAIGGLILAGAMFFLLVPLPQSSS
jgi:photosystem I P700 chlorophyll a apoprotein A1